MCIKYSISQTIFIKKSQILLFGVQNVSIKEVKSFVKIQNKNYQKIYPKTFFLLKTFFNNHQQSIRNLCINWFYLSSILSSQSTNPLIQSLFSSRILWNIHSLSFAFQKLLSYLFPTGFSIFRNYVYSNYEFDKIQNTKKYYTIFSIFLISKTTLNKIFEILCLLTLPIILSKINTKIIYQSSILTNYLSHNYVYNVSQKKDYSNKYLKQNRTQIITLVQNRNKLINNHYEKHLILNKTKKSYLQDMNFSLFSDHGSLQKQVICNQILLQNQKDLLNIVFQKYQMSTFSKKKIKLGFHSRSYSKQNTFGIFMNRTLFYFLKESIQSTRYPKWNILVVHKQAFLTKVKNKLSFFKKQDLFLKFQKKNEVQKKMHIFAHNFNKILAKQHFWNKFNKIKIFCSFMVSAKYTNLIDLKNIKMFQITKLQNTIDTEKINSIEKTKISLFNTKVFTNFLFCVPCQIQMDHLYWPNLKQHFMVLHKFKKFDIFLKKLNLIQIQPNFDYFLFFSNLFYSSTSIYVPTICQHKMISFFSWNRFYNEITRDNNVVITNIYDINRKGLRIQNQYDCYIRKQPLFRNIYFIDNSFFPLNELVYRSGTFLESKKKQLAVSDKIYLPLFKNVLNTFETLFYNNLQNSSFAKRDVFFELKKKQNDWNKKQIAIQKYLQINKNNYILFIPSYLKNAILLNQKLKFTNWEKSYVYLNHLKISFFSGSKERSQLKPTQLESFFERDKWSQKKANYFSDICLISQKYKHWFLTSQGFFLLEKMRIQMNRRIWQQFSDAMHLFCLSYFHPIWNSRAHLYIGFFPNISLSKSFHTTFVFLWEQIKETTHNWKDILNNIQVIYDFTNNEIIIVMWLAILFLVYYNSVSIFLGSSYFSLWKDFERNRHLLNPSKKTQRLFLFLNKYVYLQSNSDNVEGSLIRNIIIFPYIYIQKLIIQTIKQKWLFNNIPVDIFKNYKSNVGTFVISHNKLIEILPTKNPIQENNLFFLNKTTNPIFCLLNSPLIFSINQDLVKQKIGFHSRYLLYLFYSHNSLNLHTFVTKKQSIQYPFLQSLKSTNSSISLEVEYLISRAVLVIGSKDVGKSFLIKNLAKNTKSSLIHIGLKSLLSSYLIRQEQKEDPNLFIREIVEKILKRLSFLFHLATVMSPSIVWIPSIHEYCTDKVVSNQKLEVRLLLRSLMATINYCSNEKNQQKIMFIGSTDRFQQFDPSFLGFGLFNQLIHVRNYTSIQRINILNKILKQKQSDQFVERDFYQKTMGFNHKDIIGFQNELLLINKTQNNQNTNSLTVNLSLYRHIFSIDNVSLFVYNDSVIYNLGKTIISMILMRSSYKTQMDSWKTKFYLFSKTYIEPNILKSSVTEFMVFPYILQYLSGSVFRDLSLISLGKKKNHIFSIKKQIKHDIKLVSELLESLFQKLTFSNMFIQTYSTMCSFSQYKKIYYLTILKKIALRVDKTQKRSSTIFTNQLTTNTFLLLKDFDKLDLNYFNSNIQTSERIPFLFFSRNPFFSNHKTFQKTKQEKLTNHILFSSFKKNQQKIESFVPNVVVSIKKPYVKKKTTQKINIQLQIKQILFEQKKVQLDFKNNSILDKLNQKRQNIPNWLQNKNIVYFHLFLNKMKFDLENQIPLYLAEDFFENSVQNYNINPTLNSFNFVYFKYKNKTNNIELDFDSTKKVNAIIGEIFVYLLQMCLY